uniref:Uncharacterized protein n=2 Tax=Ditylenchus dipsaci TaxID=166011 RepID=A0A915CME7_9BILA
MMRIKEAIQRRKLIQQLNDEYAAIGESEQNSSNNFVYGERGGSSLPGGCGRSMGTLGAVFGQSEQDIGGSSPGEESKGMADHQHAYLALHQFVTELNTRLTDTHRRALRMTWKRLSEAPKTSGRGTLKIMEKVIGQLIKSNYQYVIFARYLTRRAHAKLIPMGFDRQIFHKLGECFAEVMFSQECVRAYPLAASAWSTLSVAITDKMYSHTRIARSTDLALRSSRIAAAVSSLTLGNSPARSIVISPISSTKVVVQNVKKNKRPQKENDFHTSVDFAAAPKHLKFANQQSCKKQATTSKSSSNSSSTSSLRRKQRGQSPRPPTLRMMMAQKSHFTAICGLGTQSSSLSLDVSLLNSALPKVISTPEAMAQRKGPVRPIMTKQTHISSSAESTDL